MPAEELPKPAKRAFASGAFWAPATPMGKFFRTLHAKNGEWLFLVPCFTLAIVIIFKNDFVLPEYSRVVGGGPGVIHKPPEPLDTYRLEPIHDEATGKLIAVRKVSSRQAAAASASASEGK